MELIPYPVSNPKLQLSDWWRDSKTFLLLAGEYGIDGVVLGVPAHLGAGGLVKVEELRLTESENAALQTAADAIRSRLGL